MHTILTAILFNVLLAVPGMDVLGPGVDGVATIPTTQQGPGNGLLPALDFGLEVDWKLREKRILDGVAWMSVQEQLASYLGTTPAPGGRYSEKRRVRRLLADPAIAQNFHQIRDSWFQGSLTEWTGHRLFRSASTFIQCKVMISRNLFFRGLDVNAANVRREYERIQSVREKFRDLHLFADRQVVFAASSDLAREGDYIFGRPPVKRRLARTASELVFLREANTSNSSARLASALSPSSPVTFLFEGHGRRLALKFDGKQTPEGLAASLAARMRAAGASEEPVIVILDSCQAHNFGRRLLEILHDTDPGMPMPIVITPEEYGQDFVKSAYNDRFLIQDLRIPYRSRKNLGALLEGFSLVTSIYVPDENNELTQIG